MAYLELDKVAYDNLIKAAGLKASSIAKVCQEQGVWEPQAAKEAPPGVQAEEKFEATSEAPEAGDFEV